MTLLDMPKGVVGDQNTKLTSPYTAGTDTTITVVDATVIPDATSSAPNLASVRMPNKSCLVTFSYTGKTGNTITGVTVVESDIPLGLTATYPAGSKVYWSMTKRLLDNMIDNIASGGGGGGTWGSITGDIEDQTDLQEALDAKLGKQYTSSEDGYIAKVDSADHVLKVMAAGTTSVSFADITGQPSDNTNLNTALTSKVDKVTGKGLSENDYTDADKAIVDGVTTALEGKVDKVTGKGLSTNDYTTAEKTKLAGIEDSAEVNIIEVVKRNGTALTITDKAVDVTVPTKTSDITNDSDYQTGTEVDTSISTHNSSSSAHSDIRTAITDHTGNTSNPHSVTKSQVGLGNVDNTSDVNKPISTATQTALDAKLGTVYTSAEDGYIAKVDSADHKLKVMAAGTTSVAFADITGQPTDNTNLSTALAGKEPVISTKNTAFNKNFGSTSGTVCEGNDSRLSDARTPLSHVHAGSDITSGTVAYARLPVGTTASTVCAGNDSRLTDARDPNAHASTHATGGTDAITPASIGAATASALTTHTSDTSNPHSVTATQIGVEEGAEVNVIETVKVNGTALTPTSKAVNVTVPTALSSLSDDATHRLVTDTEKSAWNSKQSALTFDNVPTEDSSNPVKSGGVYSALAGKVDTETGKGLSTNDYTTAEKTKLSGIATGAQVNVLESVKDSSGTALTITGKAVTLSKAAVGLGNVDNTADPSKIFDASQVTSGVFGIARIPTGSTSSTVCVGDDSRLSDARTPLAHVHSGSDITSGTVAYARLPVGTAASTVCAGDDSRFTTLSNHVANTSNPHSVTKSQVGLGNCDNTSDANKPISTATQTALNAKQNEHSTATATLTVAGWSSKSQTVSVSGVTASNTVFVAPAGSSYSDYATSLIRCTAQASGTLTFVCDEVPSSAVTVNVVILA